MSTFRGMSDAKHSKPTGGVFFFSEDSIKVFLVNVDYGKECRMLIEQFSTKHF